MGDGGWRIDGKLSGEGTARTTKGLRTKDDGGGSSAWEAEALAVTVVMVMVMVVR